MVSPVLWLLKPQLVKPSELTTWYDRMPLWGIKRLTKRIESEVTTY
jgi:hypothetical protein